jgi:primase-polymerase (primpol)-like protein
MTIIAVKNIPEELIERRQWVIWRYVQKPGKPKPDKVPHTAMGYRADATCPDHWSSYEVVLERSQRPGFCDGIGYAFSPDDPYTGIDLDNVWQSDADEGAPWAMRILERFADTYGEASPSDHGVKLWCRAKSPRCGKWPIEHGAIEVYDHSRFFTVTGRSGKVHIITDHQSDVEALVANLDENLEEGQRQAQARAIPEVIPKGQRHRALVSLTGTMFRRGMTAEAIEAALLVTNEKQCDPPYPPEHVHKIVASTAKWKR